MSQMDIVGIALNEFDDGQIRSCGLVYGKCILDDESEVLRDES